MITNQYGRSRRAATHWGFDAIEGDLPEMELLSDLQTKNNEQYRFRDEGYYASKEYNISDIKVPVLSVGN